MVVAVSEKFSVASAGSVVALTDDEYAALVAATPLLKTHPHLDTLLDRVMAFRLAVVQAAEKEPPPLPVTEATADD